MITAQITGNVTRDPEVKYMKDGNSVTVVSVAVKQTSVKTKDGRWEDRKPWYVEGDVWGPEGVKVADKLRKGDYVLMTGTLLRDNWTSESGEEKERFKLKKTQVELLESKVDRLARKNATAKPEPSAPQGSAPPAVMAENEIPF